MTALREAIVLPGLLLTVVLLGGMRLTGDVAFVPPPLFALVLAVLLIGTLIRSGALAPERLVHSARPPLAAVNGSLALLALFLASAQVFHLVTPESGLPRLAFHAFFLVLLLNTWASSPDRTRLLRSLMVIFGASFVFKFIVLAAISDPAAGPLHRVMRVLLDGVTLGTLTQQPFHPALGYIAFLTLALFLGAIALLPPPLPTPRADVQRRELRVHPPAGELVE
jgi:hypothetical protein